MKRYSAGSIFFFLVFFFFFAAHLPYSANGQQISTSCTNLLMKSFTPCLNFLTGSTNGGGGGSPTSECCKSLGVLISSSTQCACLVITGSSSLPINQTLAISLPRLCKNTHVPLQCNSDVGSPIPGPGPVSFSPALPPLPTQTDTPPSGTVDSPPPSVIQSPPAATSPPSISTTPADQGSGDQGLQQLILPNSALKISTLHSSFAVMSMLAIIYLF
ncbi:non-specific lipid transfer protein GPI-anchored 2-like [Phalaenopsis equestris]|uniref:non-specific lipid transfer protein GPI-anchored 2-like n=1 Tax=Phalaenopsis equestris TaxID=78828 RepID=UPI0009E4A7BC|nr:non-specific lipid transfer protein GPI-anchored 2-like [Phalaenopsis equestris]